MLTRYTVSPWEDRYAVFDDGEFYESPGTGTWGACKKLANRLNDELRPVRMKYGAQLAKDSKEFKSGNSWLVERKWDGMRAIFEIQEGETFIFSRSGQDLREQFPELCRLHEILPECILDGEVLALDPESGIENLELLQLRAGDKKASRMNDIPVTVKFFDILEVTDETGIVQDMRSNPLWYRKEVLSNLVGPDFIVDTVKIKSAEDIPTFWEGTVSKLGTSVYESGKRRSTWLKYKFVQRATMRAYELTPGKGARASSFGAVKFQDANGVHRGQVGSGFTAADINRLMDAQTSGDWPLIEIEYRFLSKTGLMVNTAYKGIRTDKEEADAL